MKLLLFIAVFVLTLNVRAQDEVVVLVPGFFNSFTAEYFSKDVISAFEKKGLKVYVANGLNPIGTIEDNGERLVAIFNEIEALEKRPVAFNIVAHSMGGHYALYVAHKQKFEIKNLITISTPYKGVEFIQNWLNNSLLFKVLTELAHLDGLVQMTPAGVQDFLQNVRVSPKMKIIAFGGHQRTSLDIWNSRYLSLPFHVTSDSISGDSDGIVAFNSAIAVGELLTTDNTKAQQYFDKNFRISLDHWEQVLEGYSFLFLGIRNPGYIKDEQTRFYNGIADHLMTLL